MLTWVVRCDNLQHPLTRLSGNSGVCHHGPSSTEPPTAHTPVTSAVAMDHSTWNAAVLVQSQVVAFEGQKPPCLNQHDCTSGGIQHSVLPLRTAATSAATRPSFDHLTLLTGVDGCHGCVTNLLHLPGLSTPEFIAAACTSTATTARHLQISPTLHLLRSTSCFGS